MVEIERRDASTTHTTCGNTFHLTCFENWHDRQFGLHQSTTCPICRADLNPPRFYQNIRSELLDHEIQESLARGELERRRRLALQQHPTRSDSQPSVHQEERWSHRNHGIHRLVPRRIGLSRRPDAYRFGMTGRTPYPYGPNGYVPIEPVEYPLARGAFRNAGRGSRRFQEDDFV